MAASSQGVRAGRAFVEMFLDDTKMLRALDAVKARFASFASFTAKLGGGLAAAGGTFFAPLTKLLLDAAKYGSKIAGLSKNLGETAESVSLLAGAAQQAGIEVEDFGEQMTQFALKISHAADMNDELIDGLRGLKGRNLMGLGSIDEQLDAVADRIKGIPSAVDRLRVIKDLGFDPRLLKFFEKGKKGLDEMRAAAKAGGWQMSAEQAKQSKAVTDSLTAAWAGFKGILLEVGAALLPPSMAMGDLSERVKEAMADARKWVGANRGLIVSIAAISGTLVAAGSGLGVLSAAAAAAIPVIIGLKMAVAATAAGIGFLLTPIGLVTAGIATIGVAWATQTDKGREFVNTLGTGFESVAETLKTGWNGLFDALKSGDLTLAGEIAIASLKVVWQTGLNEMQKAWTKFKSETIGPGTVFDKSADAVRHGLQSVAGLGAAIQKGSIEAGQAHARALRQAEDASKPSQDKSRKDAANAAELIAEDELYWMKHNLNNLVAKASTQAGKMASRDGNSGAGGYFGLGAAIGRGLVSSLAAMPVRKLPSITQMFEAQKGTFQGPIPQMLSLGDTIAKRQLDAVLAVAANTAPLPQAAKDLNKLAGAMKFK